MSSLALELSRKHKRLLYWKGAFLTGTAPEALQAEVKEMLQTYALLITRLAKDPEGSAQRAEAESHIAALERKLDDLFESRRLATSKRGTARVEEPFS